MLHKNWIWALMAAFTFATTSCSKLLDDINTELDTTTSTNPGTSTNTDTSSVPISSTDTAATDSTSGGSDSTHGTGTQADTESDTTTTPDGGTGSDSSPNTDTDSDTDTAQDTTSADTDTTSDATTGSDSTSDSDTQPECDTETDCKEKCHTCLQGRCVPVSVGVADPANICQEDSDNPCGTNGKCDEDGNCQLKQTPNSECDRKCESGYETVYTCTETTHLCEALPSPTLCELGCVASGTICKAPCTADAECNEETQFCCTDTLAGTDWCSEAGNCVAKRSSGDSVPDGAGTDEAYRCESGVIADGVCCADPNGCSGDCEYCSPTGGLCSPYDDRVTAVSSGGVCSMCMYCNGTEANCVYQLNTDDVFNECAEETDECGYTGNCDGSGRCEVKLPENAPCGTDFCDPAGTPPARYWHTCNAGRICQEYSENCTDGYQCNTGATSCTPAGECTIDSNCVSSSHFCCTLTDDTAVGCTAGECWPFIAQAADCSEARQCATTYCADNVCCDGACEGECALCNGTYGSTSSGECATGNAVTGWPDPMCIVSSDSPHDACAGTCGSAGCVYPGTDAICGDECDACNGDGLCNGVPTGIDDRCSVNTCNGITMYQQVGDDGPSYVTACQSAGATTSQTSNCDNDQTCLSQTEWCIAPAPTSAEWTHVANAHLCEGWGTQCIGTTGPSGSPDYFTQSTDICSGAPYPSGTCAPPPGAGFGPVCVAEPPRLIWPENGINLWPHNGNSQRILNGQQFVLDSPFATQIPELGGQAVDIRYQVQFSYTRNTFEDDIFHTIETDACQLELDASSPFYNKISCTSPDDWQNFTPQNGYIFWRAVQTYNYGMGDIVQESKIWQFKPHAPNDVDGDGLSDIIIASANNPYLIFGSTLESNDQKDLSLADPPADTYIYVEFNVTAGTSFTTSWIANVGDVNGDRLDDIVLTNQAGNSTSAFLILGRTVEEWKNATSDWTAPFDVSTATNSHTINFRSNGVQHYAGGSIIATDLNGDGMDELIIDSYRDSYDYDSGAATHPWRGEVYVFVGRQAWSALNVSSADFILYGDNADAFGTGLSAVGDVNGDGFLDFLVGEAYQSKCYAVHGASSLPTGLTYIEAVASTTFTGSGYAGYTNTGGVDINFDGYSDVLIGAPTGGTTFSGTSYLMLSSHADNGFPAGTVALLSAADTVFLPAETCSYCHLGNTSALGRYNSDIQIDLLAGMRVNSVSTNLNDVKNGTAYLVFDISESIANPIHMETSTVVDHVLRGESEGSQFGWTVANIGDFDNDGLEDIAIASQNQNAPSGKVYAISSSLLSTYTVKTIDDMASNEFSSVRIIGKDTPADNLGSDIGNYPPANNLSGQDL